MGAIVLTPDHEIGEASPTEQHGTALDFDPVGKPFRAIVARVAAAGPAALTIEHRRMMPRIGSRDVSARGHGDTVTRCQSHPRLARCKIVILRELTMASALH